MKSKKLVIAAATLAMIGAASVGPAMAYFTDSEYAKGKVEVSLGDSTIFPHEDVEGFEKTVVVENTGDFDVFVRVKAYAGSTVKVDATTTTNWTLDGGYYEYNYVVEAGGETKPIVFTVTPPAKTDQKQFNVIIYEEATRAVYDENGNASKNWNLAYKSQTVVDNEGGTDDEE